jgi:hypothetical protein
MRALLLFISFLVIGSPLWAKKKAVPNTQYQFIQNKGQFHPNALYQVQIPNGELYLENNTFTYHFYDAPYRHHGPHGDHQEDLAHNEDPIIYLHAYKVTFDGANTQEVTNAQKAPNYYNYYLGNNPDYWAKNVPAYEELTYHNLYPGIDLKLTGGATNGLKYDLIVAPNADPNQIATTYTGADSVYLKNGKLYIKTSISEHIENKPYAYQIVNGKEKKVSCKYVLDGTTLGYDFPNGYDPSLPLVIDPVLVFSSYTGATSNNFGYTATYDKFGFLYSGRSSFALGYPTTI